MAVKRDTLILAVQTRLKTITVANGYYTDVGTKVGIWRVTPYDVNELPAISIQDFRDELLMEFMPTKCDWGLNVRIACIANPAQLADGTVRKMITDVYKAIGTDHTFGGLAIKTDLETDEIELQQTEHRLGVGTINIVIHYRTNKFAEE